MHQLSKDENSNAEGSPPHGTARVTLVPLPPPRNTEQHFHKSFQAPVKSSVDLHQQYSNSAIFQIPSD